MTAALIRKGEASQSLYVKFGVHAGGCFSFFIFLSQFVQSGEEANREKENKWAFAFSQQFFFVVVVAIREILLTCVR